jgi:hypothetical protein
MLLSYPHSNIRIRLLARQRLVLMAGDSAL